MEAVSILAVGAALLLYLAMRWPAGAALGLYALSLPFDSVLVAARLAGIHLHITWFLGAAAACVLLTLGLAGRGFRIPLPASVWVGLLVFWALLSSFWTINPDMSTFRLPVLFLLLGLYFVVGSVRVTQEELAVISWLAILGGCLAAAASLYQLSRGQVWLAPDGLEPEVTRATLIAGDRMTDPNTLGASLALPFSMSMAALFSSHRWFVRLLLIGALLIIGACIGATMSRGAMLGTAVILLVYFSRLGMKRSFVFGIAVFGILLLATPAVFFERISESVADRGSGRLDIWIVGLETLKHYPILGAGLDCFPLAYSQYVHLGSGFRGLSRAPHNIFLGTSVELGMIGLILLLAMITAHVRLAKAIRSLVHESFRMQLLSFEAAFWGVLVCGLFIDLLWEQYLWFTFMLLLMTARMRGSVQESESDDLAHRHFSVRESRVVPVLP